MFPNESGATATSLEEDKNYSSAFTFRSGPVTNTLVGFFDQYLRYVKDPDLGLCIYAQTTVGEENIDQHALSKIAGLKNEHLGKQSILKNLNTDIELNDVEKHIALCIFKEEYIKQYTGRHDRKVGNVEIVKTLKEEEFYEFLKCIDWYILDENNDDLEDVIIEKIKESTFFDFRMENRADLILARLYLEFTKRKSRKGFFAKFVTQSDVELIFLKASSDPINTDSSWKHWHDIEVDDYRNLKEKILSVCPRLRTH